MCFKTIFVIMWMLMFTYQPTQTLTKEETVRIVIIDQRGCSSLECCAGYQGYHCSNLSLALENIQSNTEIILMSDISLEYVKKFKDISNVTITGQDHTIRCNHQGGLVGEKVANIVVKGVAWDKCNLTNVKLTQYSVKSTFLLEDDNRIFMNKSTNTALLNNKTADVIIVLSSQQPNNCNDIMHYFDVFDGNCTKVSCQDKTWIPPGCICQNNYLVIPLSYWYDNGLREYVKFCPNDYCNPFSDWYNKSHPDSKEQCMPHRGGYSCGECIDGYSIRYGTTNCISSQTCLISSVSLSLLILFTISFIYWCLVIAFIFLLLHFNFSVTAGYAFGLIFYYSVLEQVFNGLSQVFEEIPCGIASSHHDNNCRPSDFIMMILPFFSSIGNLKPPFMQYLKLCIDGTDMIDHLLLVYIHPLIVFIIVVTIFVSARKFVFAARYIGRYVNSKSISLLILLSYSSISYTSVQLLRPLATFHTNTRDFAGWRSYWSPSITYFQGRHAAYATIAILCEVMIGFGFPFLLLFQRYLTRHHNMNFMSIRPIIDQLTACYRNECYWFSTYYLICRQVIYGVDIIGDFLLLSLMNTQHYTFAKYLLILMVCIFIMVIHLWFQPYRIKSLNALDGAILLVLVFMLASSFDLSTYYVSLAFFVLPFVLFINYLSYSTKMRHVVIFVSLCGLFLVVSLSQQIGYNYSYYAPDGGIILIFCVIILLSLIAVHLIYLSIKLVILVIKYRTRRVHMPREEVNLLANDVQNNTGDDEGDDSD